MRSPVLNKSNFKISIFCRKVLKCKFNSNFSRLDDKKSVCCSSSIRSSISLQDIFFLPQLQLLGFVHKWCHAISSDFWPLPPSSRFLLLRPFYCCHKILDTSLQDSDVIYGRPLKSSGEKSLFFSKIFNILCKHSTHSSSSFYDS